MEATNEELFGSDDDSSGQAHNGVAKREEAYDEPEAYERGHEHANGVDDAYNDVPMTEGESQQVTQAEMDEMFGSDHEDSEHDDDDAHKARPLDDDEQMAQPLDDELGESQDYADDSAVAAAAAAGIIKPEAELEAERDAPADTGMSSADASLAKPEPESEPVGERAADAAAADEPEPEVEPSQASQSSKKFWGSSLADMEIEKTEEDADADTKQSAVDIQRAGGQTIPVKLVSRSKPGDDQKLYTIRFPDLVAVDAIPFDKEYPPSEFQPGSAVMRWRYTSAQDAVHKTKESNTRLIRWSDGSMQLVIGKQVFTLREHALADHRDFLYVDCGGDTKLKHCHGAFSARLRLASTTVRDEFKRNVAARHKQDKKIKMQVSETLTDAQFANQRQAEELKMKRRNRRPKQQRTGGSRAMSGHGFTSSFLEDGGGPGYEGPDADAEEADLDFLPATIHMSEEQEEARDEQLNRAKEEDDDEDEGDAHDDVHIEIASPQPKMRRSESFVSDASTPGRVEKLESGVSEDEYIATPKRPRAAGELDDDDDEQGESDDEMIGRPQKKRKKVLSLDSDSE